MRNCAVNRHLQEVRHNGHHVAQIGKVRRQLGEHCSAENRGTDGRKAQDGHVTQPHAAAVRLPCVAYTHIFMHHRHAQCVSPKENNNATVCSTYKPKERTNICLKIIV